MTTFPCQFINSRGEKCLSPASFRLHFSNEHPFDHVDTCAMHMKEYKYFAWFQVLEGGSK